MKTNFASLTQRRRNANGFALTEVTVALAIFSCAAIYTGKLFIEGQTKIQLADIARSDNLRYSKMVELGLSDEFVPHQKCNVQIDDDSSYPGIVDFTTTCSVGRFTKKLRGVGVQFATPSA